MVLVAVGAFGVVDVASRRHPRASSAALRRPAPVPAPVVSSVPPTTQVYQARPGPNGTKLLTEPVDPLTLAVPTSWTAAAADEITLPDDITRFAQQAAPLAALLQAQKLTAVKGGVRLFAYQPTAPQAFVMVVSSYSPGAAPLTASGVSAMVSATKKTPNVAVTGATLPVGQVLKVDQTSVAQKQRVAVEAIYVGSPDRLIVVEMAAVADTAGPPALFAQIAQTISLS